MDPLVPSSPRTLYYTERVNARARFEVEAEYKASSFDPRPLCNEGEDGPRDFDLA
jgi:hypothetical protein